MGFRFSFLGEYGISIEYLMFSMHNYADNIQKRQLVDRVSELTDINF